jgi:hypothetical protein
VSPNVSEATNLINSSLASSTSASEGLLEKLLNMRLGWGVALPGLLQQQRLGSSSDKHAGILAAGYNHIKGIFI